MLVIENLTKHFGGLTATDNLSLDIKPGELHAIIGPNGAGKTTLIRQITGEIPSDGGTIRFNNENITSMSVPARSHRGLARSFQITTLFPNFTVLENVSLAVQAHMGHSFKFWKDVRKSEEIRSLAIESLREVAISEQQDSLVSALSHGEQRQVEIAVALATNPKLLLLDEPMAGMSVEDSKRLEETLQKLKARYTILLIEHDMDVVFSLADRISVLVYGHTIATGTPDEIKANEEVRKAYLGDAA